MKEETGRGISHEGIGRRGGGLGGWNRGCLRADARLRDERGEGMDDNQCGEALAEE